MTDTSKAPGLAMLVIYDRPTDYPDKVVVRRWEIFAGGLVAGKLVITASSLQAARRLIPAGMICLPRHPSDDPKIVESWI